jgi:hypothetical protein
MEKCDVGIRPTAKEDNQVWFVFGRWWYNISKRARNIICGIGKGIDKRYIKPIQFKLRLMEDFRTSAKQIEEMYNKLEAKQRAENYMSLKDGYKEKKDTHYDNSNGSLYLFAEQNELNAWEFDIIKRIVRCRKKGQFQEDLQKTVRVIELYLKEFEL